MRGTREAGCARNSGGAVWIGSFRSLQQRLTKEHIEEVLRLDLMRMNMTFLFIREVDPNEIEYRDANSLCWAAPSLF